MPKLEYYHDNFQNYKRYNIPKAQLVIADIPYTGYSRQGALCGLGIKGQCRFLFLSIYKGKGFENLAAFLKRRVRLFTLV